MIVGADALKTLRVPATLRTKLESAARYRTPGRWNVLYRILWRVVTGEPMKAPVGAMHDYSGIDDPRQP
jgi:hypothetical protein